MSKESFGPCRAALEANERGKTFQLKSWRESLPPLHQNSPKPLPAFEDGFDFRSECKTFFPMPCLEETRPRLVTIWQAEPIVAKESTFLNHSAESASWRKFNSNCYQRVYKNQKTTLCNTANGCNASNRKGIQIVKTGRQIQIKWSMQGDNHKD